MTPQVKRTYRSQRNRNPTSSQQSAPFSTKRPLEERPLASLTTNIPPQKRARISENSTQCTPGTKQKTLTQLHFCIDQTILQTCTLCGFTYTKGAPDDEALHRAHCVRVRKGMEWGKEENKETSNNRVVEVSRGVKLKDGSKGRIICFHADVKGKIKSKLTVLLDTVGLALSSPPLTPSILHASKAYLFLLPPKNGSTREKIVGCLIAQRISSAMVIDSVEANDLERSPSTLPIETATALAPVDTAAGVFCRPTPLATPLGISRLFVSSAHRRKGIASKLLSAAAETFIHGCRLDPQKGQVAFTQPTGDGKAVMQRWGGGGVRIYEE